MRLNEKKYQLQTSQQDRDAPTNQISDAQPAQKRGASTLLFSFASLELRLSEPAKPAAPTESGYPQGHRMHKTEHSAGAD